VHEDDQADLFDHERFVGAASGTDVTEGFLFQLRGGVKAPDGFQPNDF
jgi:hypothetical protein